MIMGIPRPVAITLSANGVSRTKADYLGLPVKSEELVEMAKSGVEAGAAIFSFSVRGDKSRVSYEIDHVTSVVRALREATDGAVLLQLELVINEQASVSHMQDLLRTAKPDACLVRLDQLLPRDGDETDESAAQKFLAVCEELAIGVQFMLTSPIDIDWFYAFRQYGIIPESCKALLLVLGEDGDAPESNPHILRGYLAGLEKQYLLGKVAWSVAAFGPQEPSALAASIAFGGHIAPGFAYNAHTVEREPFSSVTEQIAPLCEIEERLGRPTASAFEARTLLFGTR